MQQKLQNSCSRCKKNTCNVESDYILLFPKYLINIVNRFRYNYVTKDRCSILMDMAIVLGLHNFFPAGYLMYSLISKITEFEISDTKNSSIAYVLMYKLIT